MKFVRGGYVSIHFPKMHLGTHIKDTLHESTKLVGDPRRDLQKFFVGGEGDLEMDLDNEKDDDWDQFKVNELKHNVVTTFDPSKYTTELNMKALSKKQIEVGAAIAESIENAPSASYHIREDRGQIKRSAVEEDEDDEERAYSAVIGTGNYKDGSTKINRKNQLGNTRQVKPRHIDNANGNGKKKFDRGKEVGKAKPVKQDKKETLDSKPVALPTFTNSKKNMEMKQSIEAALGMKIEKPATEEVKKDTEQPLAETKSPSAKIVDQDTAKKQSSQTNLSVAAKEFKPKPKDTPLSPNIPPKGKEEIKGHTAAATPQLESKPKLNTGAKDFTPKTVASVKPEPKAETKLSLALKTTAKEFKPSSHVTTKEAPTPANIVTLTIKPLANSNLVNLRATYKQFEKKKVVPTIAKDTWTTSPEITIKEVKPQPATPVYDNSTAQQPQYYYDGYYTGYYPPQQYYGMGYYPQGVNMYGGNGMYGYQGQEQMQGMAYPERGYLPNKQTNISPL
eukprot:TRINITY_DN71582_c0_g1_i1.p1 TRINITY_DN71582_c0_g1~~TRINITY_DN71582_c0_g1_i1.p1  ORF type:complete len:506 (+),score=88.77 TRINITY_DN71582_c0_g1_i1:1480-2997(+)